MPDDPGFNRYMVECEFKGMRENHGHRFVLIDTWWNVNDRSIPGYCPGCRF